METHERRNVHWTLLAILSGACVGIREAVATKPQSVEHASHCVWHVQVISWVGWGWEPARGLVFRRKSDFDENNRVLFRFNKASCWCWKTLLDHLEICKSLNSRHAFHSGSVHQTETMIIIIKNALKPQEIEPISIAPIAVSDLGTVESQKS